MGMFRIRGGRKLEGSIRVIGSKNAILPILAAVILTRKPVVCMNPQPRSVENMLRYCNGLQIKENSTLFIDRLDELVIPDGM